MAAALATDDVSLELRDDKTREDVDLMADLTSAREEETVTDSTSAGNLDRPRSGKEARKRRAERIASALSRGGGGGGGGDDDKDDDEEDDPPVGYEEYER